MKFFQLCVLIFFATACFPSKENVAKEDKSTLSSLCAEGELKKCYDLGNLELNEGNTETAKGFYKKVCDAGKLHGCYGLGLVAYAEKNMTLAKEIFTGLCSKDDSESCVYLASMANNEGNTELARTWLEKSCSLKNFKYGCLGLASLEKETGNIDKANQIYKTSCDNNILDACFEAGVIEQKNNNTSVAKSLLTEACDGDVLKACDQIGAIFHKEGNTKQAKEVFKKACKEVTQSCSKLGAIIYLEGDHEEAKEIWKKSCSSGEQLSCEALSKIGIENTGSLSTVPSHAGEAVWDIQCSKESLLKHFSLKELNSQEREISIGYYILSGIIQEVTGENFNPSEKYTHYFDKNNVFACKGTKLLLIENELVDSYFDTKKLLTDYQIYKNEIISKHGDQVWKKNLDDTWTRKKNAYLTETFGHNNKYTTVTLLTKSRFTLYRINNELKAHINQTLMQKKQEFQNQRSDEINKNMKRI